MAEFRVMERVALAEPRPAYKPLRGQTALDGRGTRDAFLASLRSAGRYKYGRYNGLPLRYAGGKSLAVGHVVENLPSRLSRVVSPFIGGGSVEIACARELGVPVQGYDVFDVLTNYWEVQLSAPKALAERLRQWEPTQQRYRQVKQRLKEHWIGTRPIHDALELAAHYWFNPNLAYGPGFLGWMSKIYEDEVRYERLVAKVERFSCPTLSVRQGGFEEAIPAHSGDFLYCDPPYYLDGDSKMFRGIYPQRNFPIHHANFRHDILRDLLRRHEGGFVLSYNDCETIREWYADCKIIEVEWQYTLGQGETRIGKNRIENGTNHHVKASHELLIVKEARNDDGPCQRGESRRASERVRLRRLDWRTSVANRAARRRGRAPRRAC